MPEDGMRYAVGFPPNSLAGLPAYALPKPGCAGYRGGARSLRYDECLRLHDPFSARTRYGGWIENDVVHLLVPAAFSISLSHSVFATSSEAFLQDVLQPLERERSCLEALDRIDRGTERGERRHIGYMSLEATSPDPSAGGGGA